MQTLEDRFLKKINKTSSCWLWTGSKTRGGYGNIRAKVNSKWTMRRSHIVSYELYKGPVNGLQVCHSCDTPSCVNPDHLWLGTAKENADDMVSKGRNKISVTRSKITHLDAESIRRLYSKGVLQKDIAALFGIARNTVSTIVNNKRWKPL